MSARIEEFARMLRAAVDSSEQKSVNAVTLGGKVIPISGKKDEIAWMLASLLDPDRQHGGSEIDALIRQNVKPEILKDPSCAPDHIRVAMIEHQFLERDSAGTTYRLPDAFVDAFGDRIKRLSFALPDEDMQCPGCWSAKVLKGRNLYQHYLKKHVPLQGLNEIIRKYFNWNL
jgi:hypothetical protein